MIKQADIVTVDFEPSKGHEIRKRRPALVMSRDEYNKSTPLIIVCPITSTDRVRPFLIPLRQPVDDGTLDKESKVNTTQVYSLDRTEQGGRNVQVIGHLDDDEFYVIAQYLMQNFNFDF